MSDEKNTISQAFVKAYSQIENATKNKQGQVGQQKYWYATLEAVLDVVRPALNDNKLALLQYVDGDTLKTSILHDSGAIMELGAYGLGQLIDHQKRGSAITYGRRYMICSIFGIGQEDDDAASAGNVKNPVEQKPKAEPVELPLPQRYAAAVDYISKATTLDGLKKATSKVTALLSELPESESLRLSDIWDAKQTELGA